MKKNTKYPHSYYKLFQYQKPPISDLLEWMKSDKKNQKEKINFTLLNSIGSSIINQEYTADELHD